MIKWFSLFFWIVGTIAIIAGIKNEDTYMLCLGALLWIGSNFLEIIISRMRIKQLFAVHATGEQDG